MTSSAAVQEYVPRRLTGKLVDDYVVMQQERMIHLINAPSPAATSSLSIGEFVALLAYDKLLNS